MQFPAINKKFTFTEEMKETLLTRWLAYDEVQSALHKHAIGSAFFGHYFGSKVINYAVGVIEGVNQLGNCPMVAVMLTFFEKKNIPLGDVFRICVNLKNAFTDLALEKGKLDHDTLFEICQLMDQNFHGVITEYLRVHYEELLSTQACPIDYPSASPFSPSPPVQLSNTQSPVTSAADYAREVDFDRDIFEELSEIEQEALSSLGLTETISQTAKTEVVDLFSQYAKMLERLVEFEELSYALWMLIDLLKKMNLEEMGDESTYVVIYVKAIINDLSAWRIDVFVDQNAEDIHYLDKTLLSSIAQLQILLSPTESENVENMEFF